MFTTTAKARSIFDRNQLIQQLLESDTAVQIRADHSKRREDERLQILSEIKPERARLSAELKPLLERHLVIKTEWEKVSARAKELFPLMMQGECCCSTFNQRIAGCEEFHHTRVRELADPRIERVMEWLDTAGSKIVEATRYGFYIKRNWMTGAANKVETSNFADTSAAFATLRQWRGELNTLRATAYEVQELGQTLEDYLRKAEHLLQEIGMSQIPERPDLSLL